MTEIDVAALRALMENATKGPYFTTGDPWFRETSGVMAGNPDPHAGYMIADCETWDGEREEYRESGGSMEVGSADADAAYIAAALNAIPALLDAFEALKEIAEQDVVNIALDPDWPKRIAIHALHDKSTVAP